MNKRLLILVGLGIAAVIGATQLIDYQKNGPAGQNTANSASSTPDLQKLNADRLPAGTPLIPENTVTWQLADLKSGVEKTLASQQQIFDSAGQMTPEQEASLSDRLATARAATIRTFTKAQLKGMLKLFRQMIQTPEYPGTHNHISPPNQPALLSWRVHMLPCLGHRALYDQFHLQEAWDSEHNLTLLKKMPPVYKHWQDDDSVTRTRLLAVNGDNTLGIDGRLRMLHSVTDPESETIAIIVVSEELAVPWTQPIDFSLNEDLFSKQMQQIGADDFLFATVEGAALDFPTKGQFATFKALATIDGEEQGALDAMFSEK